MTTTWTRRGRHLITASTLGLLALGTSVTSAQDAPDAPAPVQEEAPAPAPITLSPEAPADAKTLASVKELLGGIEYVPSAEQWKAIPNAATALRQVAADTTMPRTRRGRALSALAHFPSVRTTAFLKSTITDASLPSLLRRKAIQSAVVAMKAEALPLLTPMLADQDKRLRESTIRALGQLKTPQARALLKDRLQAEPAPYLQDLLQASLKP